MSLRAQLSLLFDDQELYNQFIVPCKQAKSLNGIIIRCLSAYYYNEEIRNLIEGSKIEVEDVNVHPSTQEICDNIRNTLLMQSILAGELEATLSNGAEDVKDILERTNNLAKDSGLAEERKTSTGSTMLQIESKIQDSSGAKSRSSDGGKVSIDSGLLDRLVLAVTKLAEASGNTEVSTLLGGTSEVVPEEVSKTSTKTPEVEVVIDEPETVQDLIGAKSEEPVQIVEEVHSDIKDDFSPDDEPIDATSSISDLIGSLGF